MKTQLTGPPSHSLPTSDNKGKKSNSGRPARVSFELAAHVASRLTERDRQILRLIAKARVLTTDQLREVFFDNETTARHRLSILWQLRLLDRFQPQLAIGSAPYHYVIDQLGAMVLSVERNDDPYAWRWRRDRALRIASSQHLAHRVGANGFFTSLIATARTRSDCSLVRWWTDQRCKKELHHIVVPDGLGIWREDWRRIIFFLEYDRSTEPLGRLVDKLRRYEKLKAATTDPFVILFSFATVGREATARHALANWTAPIGTCARWPTRRPNEAVWWQIGESNETRVPLIALSNSPVRH